MRLVHRRSENISGSPCAWFFSDYSKSERDCVPLLSALCHFLSRRRAVRGQAMGRRFFLMFLGQFLTICFNYRLNNLFQKDGCGLTCFGDFCSPLGGGDSRGRVGPSVSILSVALSMTWAWVVVC